MALFELEGITRSYMVGGGELKVLKGIDLVIEEGEFVAIMGPSGSGKSTMMQIIGLLDRPTGGSYRLMDRDVSNLSDDEGAALRSRTIGFIFQMFNLLKRTSTLDNVALPLIYAGAPDRDARATEVLTMVGLQDRLDHAPNQLSGGQQQRVAIARALVNSPKILFADEPTGNLASAQAEEILKELQALNRGGITVIMVTHEPDIAAYAKRVIKIKDGYIISDELNPKPTPPRDAAPAASPLMKPGRAASPTRSSIRTPKSAAEFGEYGASAMRAMAANKVRSALSMLGILIGVGAVIAMLAIGKGAQKAVEARIAGLGSNLVMLIPGSTSVGGVRGGSGTFSRLTAVDVKAISRINHVARAEGNVRGNGQVVYKSANWSTSVYGATPSYAKIRNSTPYYGRFFTAAEDQAQARFVLLGQTVVKILFGAQANPGRQGRSRSAISPSR